MLFSLMLTSPSPKKDMHSPGFQLTYPHYLNLHINGVAPNILFCVWHILLNMLVRCTHGSMCSCCSVLWLQCFLMWKYQDLCEYFILSRHTGCSEFGVIAYNPARSMLVHMDEHDCWGSQDSTRLFSSHILL